MFLSVKKDIHTRFSTYRCWSVCFYQSHNFNIFSVKELKMADAILSRFVEINDEVECDNCNIFAWKQPDDKSIIKRLEFQGPSGPLKF